MYLLSGMENDSFHGFHLIQDNLHSDAFKHWEFSQYYKQQLLIPAI
jgi:hypothetical protein